MPDDRRAISWQSLFLYIALPIIFGISGFMISDLFASVKTLRDTKLDKTEFYQIADRQEKKADLIIQLLRDHEQNVKKRSAQ